jgi:hypothetical protein
MDFFILSTYGSCGCLYSIFFLFLFPHAMDDYLYYRDFFYSLFLVL